MYGQIFYRELEASLKALDTIKILRKKSSLENFSSHMLSLDKNRCLFCTPIKETVSVSFTKEMFYFMFTYIEIRRNKFKTFANILRYSFNV